VFCDVITAAAADEDDDDDTQRQLAVRAEADVNVDGALPPAERICHSMTKLSHVNARFTRPVFMGPRFTLPVKTARLHGPNC